jgi:hypothetical protein
MGSPRFFDAGVRSQKSLCFHAQALRGTPRRLDSSQIRPIQAGQAGVPRRQVQQNSRFASQIATHEVTAKQTYEEAFAVEVPGMSVPQKGWDDTGVKPVLFALTIQAQLFESWPKLVEKFNVMGRRPLAL